MEDTPNNNKVVIECSECGTKYKLKSASLTPEGRKVRCSYCDNIWTQFPINSSEMHIASTQSPDGFDPSLLAYNQKQKSDESSVSIDDSSQTQSEAETAKNNNQNVEEEYSEEKDNKIETEDIHTDDEQIEKKLLDRKSRYKERMEAKKNNSKKDESVKRIKKTPLWVKIATIPSVLIMIASILLSFGESIPSLLAPIYSSFGIYDTTLLEFSEARIENEGQNKFILKAEIVNNSLKPKNVPALRYSVYNKDGTLIENGYIPPQQKIIPKNQKFTFIQELKHLNNMEPQNAILDIGNPLELSLE